MAAVRVNAVRNITNQLCRLSTRKNLPIYTQYLFRGKIFSLSVHDCCREIISFFLETGLGDQWSDLVCCTCDPQGHMA